MRRLGIAPQYQYFDQAPTNDWLKTVTDRLNVYSGASDPTVDEVPENQWVVYYNTTSSELRIWTNIAGVMKKSAAFT
jgi:hypothetical protein